MGFSNKLNERLNKIIEFFKNTAKKIKPCMIKFKHFVLNCASSLKAFFVDLLRLEKQKDSEKINKTEKKPTMKKPASKPARKTQADNDSTVIFEGSAKLQATAENRPVIEDNDQTDAGFASIFTPRARRVNLAFSVVINTIKIVFVLLLVLGAIGVGSLIGVANAYLDTTPELDLSQIENQALTSYLYDRNGKLITSFSGMENRDWATLEEIPEKLRNGIIAVEDIRFYSHEGVDLKRIIGVFISNLSSEVVQGGSTITQQIIKNQLLSSERSYKRKIQEAYLALQLEEKYSKDQILEAYLNTIPSGVINYGVKAAAKDYFRKELKDLTLREIACLAGMTRFPYAYNPRTVYYGSSDPKVTQERIDRLDKRITNVLDEMLKAGFINKDEYLVAKNDKLTVHKESTVTQMYSMPYFVEYAIYDISVKMLEKEGLPKNKQNRAAMENKLRSGGYHIYLTVDPKIQQSVQNTISQYQKYPKMNSRSDSVEKYKNPNGTYTEVIQPQAACVVLNQKNGQLLAVVGGRSEPTAMKLTNRAYNSKMPVGSSIKPIAVYAPAFEKGASPATIIPNIPVAIPGWNKGSGYPATPSSSYGPITIRKGVVGSRNICAARTLMDEVGIEDSRAFLISMGVDPSVINADGPGLALGTSGINTIEMAGAFGCLANGGQYQEPIAFTVIKDSRGNEYMSAKKDQEKRRVFKKGVAWMITDVLEDAVSGGTGRGARIPGMRAAGKTGTNQDVRGVFFAGYTPYYTCTLWIGSDEYKPLDSKIFASDAAAPLWKKIMQPLHEGKKNKAIIAGDPEDMGLVRATVCSVSGLKPNGLCSKDPKHKPVTDWFLKGTVPTKRCNMHVGLELCAESKKKANEYCPEKITGSGIVLPKGSIYNKLPKSTLGSIFSNISWGICTDHDENTVLPTDTATTSPTGSETTSPTSTTYQTTVNSAISQINIANNVLSRNKDTLSEEDKNKILSLISELQRLIDNKSAEDAIKTKATELKNAVRAAI